MKEQPRGTKTRFIVEYGPHKPVDEIIAAGKRAGITLMAANVYQVRGRKGAGMPVPPAEVTTPKVVPVIAGKTTVVAGQGKTNVFARRSERDERDLEDEFTDLVLEMGLVRSTERIEHIRSLADQLVGR